jgi:hypothetical protein
MGQPTYRTFLGIAKESIYGTGVAATDFIPVKSFQPKDKLMFETDEAWRGSAVKSYGHVPGAIYAEHDFGGPVFADTIGYVLAGVLGDVATTGASAPYTTTFALLNSGSTQPPSYTIAEATAINALQFPGVKFSEVGFKFDGGSQFEYTAKGSSLTSSILGVAPVASFSAVQLQAGWQGIVTIGGTAVSAVASGEVNIKRPVEVVHTADGTQAPYMLWSGECTVDGKLVLVMEADTYRALYVSGASTSIDVNFAQGAGTTATQVKLHCSKATLTDASHNFGKSYIELDCTFEGDANVTDVGASAGYSPIMATVQNAKVSGTYK